MPARPRIFHAPGLPSRREANADRDARRGSARARGYDAEFDRASIAFKREHPLCLGCGAVGRISATEVTDHVVPHKGDMVIFWDRTKWQPACRWHHDIVKQLLERRFAKGELAAAELWLNSNAAIRLTRELTE
jgi:5-methylcytosine-specific restriction endonuclease McrA